LLTSIIDGRQSGFLFPGKDAANALTRPAKPFARICACAGVDGSDGQVPLVIHDLRRSFCSILARRGVEPAKLMKLMRHSSINVTMKYYTHLQDKALVEASDIVGELLMEYPFGRLDHAALRGWGLRYLHQPERPESDQTQKSPRTEIRGLP
jgi:integrase